LSGNPDDSTQKRVVFAKLPMMASNGVCYEKNSEIFGAGFH
jgi:hypothetical protein